MKDCTHDAAEYCVFCAICRICQIDTKERDDDMKMIRKYEKENPENIYYTRFLIKYHLENPDDKYFNYALRKHYEYYSPEEFTYWPNDYYPPHCPCFFYHSYICIFCGYCKYCRWGPMGGRDKKSVLLRVQDEIRKWCEIKLYQWENELD